MQAEFIFREAAFRSAHASTIVETGHGLAAAWFGGTREGHTDVTIWFAQRSPGHWSRPSEVATGRVSRLRRYPCWNPVLFQVPHGPLLLFYKVGPSPSRWWGMLIRSSDGGRTWSQPHRLPRGILGPVKNKPVVTDGGALLCPSSREDGGWRVHLEVSPDGGETWRAGPALNDHKAFAAIQPTILSYPNGRMQLLCRSRQGRITECWSEDGGQTWSPMAPTGLPNPDSGIDAVTLKDGRALLVYNHSEQRRTPLNVAISADGVRWSAVAVLEDSLGEYSYPAVIQASDGKVHVTYTWNRTRIRHAVLDPATFAPVPIDEGVGP
jgi:predicted neuraminidase